MLTTLTHEMHPISTTGSLAVSVGVERSAQSLCLGPLFGQSAELVSGASQMGATDTATGPTFADANAMATSKPSSATTGAPIWYKRHLIATRRHGGPS